MSEMKAEKLRETYICELKYDYLKSACKVCVQYSLEVQMCVDHHMNAVLLAAFPLISAGLFTCKRRLHYYIEGIGILCCVTDESLFQPTSNPNSNRFKSMKVNFLMYYAASVQVL